MILFEETNILLYNSVGYHLAECRDVPLGQVPFRKNEDLIHFANFNSLG